MKNERHSYVFITQVYVPDPNATGQHLADVAEELARRGHDVVVYTSNRGYDEPSKYYPSRETRQGVKIRRETFPAQLKNQVWWQFPPNNVPPIVAA